ncbi:glutathione S-transferase [Basidiobolus meristosporus CBS 931.73]|uniref:Glutathione S-transferase n=1 Tax=Basidiobolus meristosporus CBS 931.73 TaxID=1314790 RepID=A0A1Y1XZJ9_9FUNG|nr:glutathione S-transferase [Basidiobolus meristosporus CBS 931.73]|eukprot:ORX91162.1 glutathione S-transferase [Basidiobolus meristosporus CBS 931.73]
MVDYLISTSIVPFVGLASHLSHIEVMSSIILVGNPVSTFTRTIALGLHEKGLDFVQQPELPHSEGAKTHHPLGFIPSFSHNGFWLFESVAIANYIEEAFQDKSKLRPERENVQANAILNRWISFISQFVFNRVEHGVVKPRLSLQNEGKSENDIKDSIKQGVEEMEEVLRIVEDMLDEAGPYVMGNTLTWADLFLIPPLSDLAVIPEGNDGDYPKLSAWYKRIIERESFKKTFEGTLASKL